MNTRAAFRLSPLFKKILRLLNTKAAWAVYFLDSHYTMLSIALIGTIGTALIFLAQSLFRYSHYDWWRWKSRAVWKSARLWALLLLIKGGFKLIK